MPVVKVWHGEVGHRAVVGQGLHQRQRRAGGDRRPRQGQGHAEEAAPGAVTERSRHFQHAARPLQEGRACQHVHIGIEHEDEHDDRSAHAAHVGKPVFPGLPAECAAQPGLNRSDELQQIGIGVRHDIGRHGERQDQAPFEHAPPRKIVHHREPGRGDAAEKHAQQHARAQLEGIADVFGEHRLRQMGPDVAGAAGKDVAADRQDGNGGQGRDGQCEQGEAVEADAAG